LHGEKENFEEYSLFLESAELTFAILINYSAKKNRTCPRATVFMPCRKKVHSTSSFLLVALGLIFLNIKLKNNNNSIYAISTRSGSFGVFFYKT
jgi:hypothetical protein